MSYGPPSLSAMRQLLVFDGDDTLWDVEFLYDNARAEAASIVAGTGLDSRRWQRLQEYMDVENVAQFGLSALRFPISCVQAYEALAAETGARAYASIQVRITAAAEQVFDSVAPVSQGAVDVLAELSREYTLALLTQGDSIVQRRRVADSGLDVFFKLVRIPPLKTSESFKDVLSVIRAKPQDACSIGNSLPSDINPALALGMSAVWVASDVWEYELRETSAIQGPLLAVEDLPGVPAAVRRLLPAYEILAEA